MNSQIIKIYISSNSKFEYKSILYNVGLTCTDVKYYQLLSYKQQSGTSFSAKPLSDSNSWNVVYKGHNIQFVCDKGVNEHVIDSIHIETSEGIWVQGEKNIIKDFIDESCKKFETFQLYSNNNSSDKLNHYSYDFRWDLDSITNKRCMDSIYLPDCIKNKIRKDIEGFCSAERQMFYKNLGIPYTRVYMFYGPPGTGKTSLIKALASQSYKSIATLDFDTDLNDKLLRKAIKSVPENTILVLEDIDVLFKSRKSNDDIKNNVTFSGLLNAFDGTSSNDNLIVVMTTNHIDHIDQALKRRVDMFIEFNYITKKQVASIYEKFFCDTMYCDMCSEFIEQMNGIKTTPNVLQKYFLRMYDSSENPCEHIDVLKELNQLMEDTRIEGLYT